MKIIYLLFGALISMSASAEFHMHSSDRISNSDLSFLEDGSKQCKNEMKFYRDVFSRVNEDCKIYGHTLDQVVDQKDLQTLKKNMKLYRWSLCGILFQKTKMCKKYSSKVRNTLDKILKRTNNHAFSFTFEYLAVSGKTKVSNKNNKNSSYISNCFSKVPIIGKKVRSMFNILGSKKRVRPELLQCKIKEEDKLDEERNIRADPEGLFDDPEGAIEGFSNNRHIDFSDSMRDFKRSEFDRSDSDNLFKDPRSVMDFGKTFTHNTTPKVTATQQNKTDFNIKSTKDNNENFNFPYVDLDGDTFFDALDSFE